MKDYDKKEIFIYFVVYYFFISYDLENKLIEKFSNQIELSNKFNVHKTTISRYVRSGKIFKENFYIKEINK